MAEVDLPNLRQLARKILNKMKDTYELKQNTCKDIKQYLFVEKIQDKENGPTGTRVKLRGMQDAILTYLHRCCENPKRAGITGNGPYSLQRLRLLVLLSIDDELRPPTQEMEADWQATRRYPAGYGGTIFNSFNLPDYPGLYCPSIARTLDKITIPKSLIQKMHVSLREIDSLVPDSFSGHATCQKRKSVRRKSIRQKNKTKKQ